MNGALSVGDADDMILGWCIVVVLALVRHNNALRILSTE